MILPDAFLVVFALGGAAGFFAGWRLGHDAGVEHERRRLDRWARRLERAAR